EMYWFENSDEMLNAVDTLLHEDELRMNIVARAQSRIASDHTYASRAKAILTLLHPNRNEQ
ncbi:glycosyltransferase, partial [bacterium]|nr:glycosyltransferase [bacterium]